MLVLGIETTCDETAAAIVRRHEDGRGEIVANVILSQSAEHAAYGGVVPEIAARAHVEVLDLTIAEAMVKAGTSFEALDGVAAAAGPGLIGGIIVGLTMAKAIALVVEKPLVAVNHLEAHALTARLTDAVAFPYCLFLVSGGHTQIVAVLDVGKYVRLGTTLDDAIGEAFDKTAKLLGLGYPGGPEVEREAARGEATTSISPPRRGRVSMSHASCAACFDPSGGPTGGPGALAVTRTRPRQTSARWPEVTLSRSASAAADSGVVPSSAASRSTACARPSASSSKVLCSCACHRLRASRAAVAAPASAVTRVTNTVPLRTRVVSEWAFTSSVLHELRRGRSRSRAPCGSRIPCRPSRVCAAGGR